MSNKKLAAFIADHAKFGTWLKKKRLSTVVGYCNQSGKCPIAQYIMGSSLLKKGEVVSVDQTKIRIGTPYNKHAYKHDGCGSIQIRLVVASPDWVEVISIVNPLPNGCSLNTNSAIVIIHRKRDISRGTALFWTMSDTAIQFELESVGPALDPIKAWNHAMGVV